MPKILPVLLGADMNCYSMARAFHEAYGVVSYAFGRWPMGETQYSRIVRFTAVENFEDEAVMLHTLSQFAAQNPQPAKILLGCTDDYATFLIRHKKELEKQYIVPYIDNDLMEMLVTKERFYACCRQHGMAYPATVVLHAEADTGRLDELPFPYPVIVKPSSSIRYWKHPFAGMKKVYTAANSQEAKQICRAIFSSGYPDSLIVQDRIPGADDGMRVLTAYSDRNAKVRMVCLGHLLLEEHTPKALGNHAAIITEYNGPLMETVAKFLEKIGYTGLSNFDVKFDPRDGTYKVFEINLRQGRSNYYVTGAGLNLARYLVEDWVHRREGGQPLFFAEETYWHSIPNRVVWRYTADEALAARAMALTKERRDTTALGYRYDLRLNPLRQLYLWEHYRRYHKKYETYCEKMRE